MKDPKSEKRKELVRQYVESDGVNEAALSELHRMLRPFYYHCAGDMWNHMPTYDRDDFYQIGYITLWQVLEKCRENPDIINYFDAYVTKAIKYAFYGEYRKYVLRNPVVDVGYEDFEGGYDVSTIYFRTELRDKLRERNRKYREEHRDEINARQREYWHEHREELNARARELRKLNHDKIIERERKYREANRDVFSVSHTFHHDDHGSIYDLWHVPHQDALFYAFFASL